MWVKVDDRLPSSRKVLRIPRAVRPAAMGLWVMTAAWSSRDGTDGWIPAYVIEEHACELEHAEALVAAGMWEHDDRDGDPGYQFVKWAEYQPTQSEIDERRRIERERKAEQRRTKGGKFAGQDESHGSPTDVPRENRGTPRESHGSPTVPGPSRPDPTPPHTTPSAAAEFAEWWGHWRKKKAIGDARKAFPTARKRATLEQLIAGADAYFAWVDRNVIADQYVVGPGPWLRQERWSDELTDRTPDRQQRPNRDAASAEALVQAHFDMQTMGGPQ